MNELNPCPFCGGINVTVKQDSTMICGHRYWFISHSMPSGECPLTDIWGWWHSRPKFTTKEKAIEAWNKRAINDNNYYKKQSSCTTLDGKEWFASGGGGGK